MYKLEPLPYDYNALEPFLSERTITIHYTGHAQKYLDNLNTLLQKNKYDYRYSLEELVSKIDFFPLIDRGPILFNLGGVINHNMYFQTIGNSNHTPSGEILEKIEKEYGSYEEFKKQFIETARKLVGSGYTVLVLKENEQLDIINTANQDTTYSYGMFPIMNIDLWEHAYYLDYQNKRNEYIDKFFQWLDFKRINEAFKKAQKLQQENL